MINLFTINVKKNRGEETDRRSGPSTTGMREWLRLGDRGPKKVMIRELLLKQSRSPDYQPVTVPTIL